MGNRQGVVKHPGTRQQLGATVSRRTGRARRGQFPKTEGVVVIIVAMEEDRLTGVAALWPVAGPFVVAVQSLSCVQLLETPWTAAHKASPAFTISQSFLRLMSIELVMPSNHLILCCPLLLLSSVFPSIRFFSNESALSIGTSTSASVLPVNIQD